MNFDYSDFQRMLLDGAGRLMKLRGTVEHWRARRALPDGLDHEGWARFAELGWLALPVPEDAGGLGGSFEDVTLLMTALGRGLASEPYVSTAVLGSHIIDRAVAGDRRTDLLAAIAAGELRLALAHNESDDRFDIKTARATHARAAGDGYALNGLKMLVQDAPSAHQLIVTATLEDHPGTALFLVQRDAEGIARDSYLLLDGTHAADIRFTDVALPADALICSGADGTALLAEAVDRATIALLGEAVGSMEASLDICSAYLKERKQFGQPIGKFQALQHIATDMLVATHQSRSVLYQAIAHLDDTPAVREHAVSAAKIVAGEAALLVSRSGIQIHGGYGLTDEYAIGHHYRRLLALEKTYGDVDYHIDRLAGVAAP